MNEIRRMPVPIGLFGLLACIIRERPASGVLGGVRSWQTLKGA
jgi:hypothetical protein